MNQKFPKIVLQLVSIIFLVLGQVSVTFAQNNNTESNESITNQTLDNTEEPNPNPDPEIPLPTPVITVTAPSEVGYETPIKITAVIEGATTASITFTENKEFKEKKYYMHKEDEKTYSYTIPANYVWSKNIAYKVEATTELGTIYYPENGEYGNIPVIHSSASNAPDLLITELVANGVNRNGVDSFEFLEIYNNTKETLNLKDYAISYRYPTNENKKNIRWDLTEDFPIKSGETKVVFFPKRGSTQNNTVAEFLAYYNVSNSYNSVYTLPIGGLANTGERTIAIESDNGRTIVSATYNEKGKQNISNDKAMQYRYQNKSEMIKIDNAEVATPGRTLDGQIPNSVNEIAKDYLSPTITHKSVNQYTLKQETIDFVAEVADNRDVSTVKVYVGTQSSKDFKEYTMQKVGSGSTYSVNIPRTSITTDEILYYIEAKDTSNNAAKTDTYEAVVTNEDIAFQNISPLFITEVTPNTANVNGVDAYEFVEVYNNSTESITMNDYILRYRTPMSGPNGDILLKPEMKNITIPARGVMVFWVVNDKLNHLTGSDFNKYYNTNLQLGVNLVKVHGAALANTTHKGVVVATNSGSVINDVYYNERVGISDVEVKKGIQYYFPAPSITKGVKRGGTKQAATPGVVESYQIPSKQTSLADDNTAPVIENLTTITDIISEDKAVIKAKVTDNLAVKTVKIFYKSSKDSQYREENVQINSNSLNYEYTIYLPEYIGSENIQYYFEASDGRNVMKSEVYKIFVQSKESKEPLRLQSDYLMKGIEEIKATSENALDLPSLMIDNQLVDKTYTTLENEAYFAFEINNTNLYFKNAVTIGTDILRYMDDSIARYQTVTVPIDPKRFTKGKSLSIDIRSGSKTSPFDSSHEENKNDFVIKNIRLVMSDGKVIYDQRYQNSAKEFDIGDNGNAVEMMNFSFDVPESYFKSVATSWDTTKVADGLHTISIKNSETSINKEVKVDNTAPVITTNMNEVTYKGDFTIEASSLDALEGKKDVSATLDDAPIKLPYKTSSVKLAPGKHTLVLHTEDSIGNIGTETIVFTTVDELPSKPTKVSPSSSVTLKSNDVKLKVSVKDPTDDKVDVLFYEGYQYIPSQTTDLKVYKNASTTEPPPTLVTKGDKLLTKSELAKISKNDKETITNSSTEKFPYYRFEVKLDKSVKATDDVKITWKGSSLEDRKVSMYAWSYKLNKWVLLEYKVAGKKEFVLESYVKPKDYRKDGKINVLVQDEIAKKAEKEYEYSFAWISDTQYYSKSYQHIQEKMTQWVVDNQKKFNIQYVFHTGDLVDNADQEFQWKNSDKAFKTFDKNKIPYGVLAGNHDVGHKDGDYQMYSKYYGEKRFNSNEYYGGSYENNRGHYDLVSAKGNDYIMMYMGWGIGADEIAWMNDVLAQYPDRKAILNFHEYLLVSGQRSPIGNYIYENVVVPNKNVEAVLCGHYHDSELLVDEIDDDNDGTPDRTVYQMLADFQGGPEGGQGYLRLLLVDQDTNTIDVKTYSPYLDEYNYYKPEIYPGKDEFSIEMDLQPKEKVVTTNSFVVNVYTSKLLGTKKDVKSGATAEVLWKGLKPNNKYSWYAVVRDEYEGVNYSDVWSFTTKEYKKTK